MRIVNFKASGVKAKVWPDDSPWPSEGVNFWESELAWGHKLSKDFSDPEAEKAFWQVALQKKDADPSYSLFHDFPRTGTAELAHKYCSEIKQKLRGSA